MNVLGAGLIVSCMCLAGCSDSEAGRPRRYQYTCELRTYDVRGAFQNKIRISAVQERGLPKGMTRWRQPSVAFGEGLESSYGPPMAQPYMEGFAYPETEIQDMLKPEFFKGFPAHPLAFVMRNSIVDAHMFDVFVSEFGKLKQNVPYLSATSGADIDLGGQGKQRLKKLTLTWIGNLERNRKTCAVILFRSSVDPVSVDIPGASWAGSTVFWGEIWLSLKDRHVEHAALHEHSLTAPPDPQAKAESIQNVYRTTTLTRIVEKQ